MARGAVILAVLAALAAAPAGAQIVEKKRELAKIQSDLRRTRQELDGLRGAESALGHDVDRLQGLDARSRRRVLDLQDAIRRAEARRADLKARLASAGSVGSFWSEALLAETARHVAAEAGRADFSGSDELWAEEFRRLAILEKARHVRGLKGFQRKVAEDEEQARARASELDESRRRAQAEREGRRREYESKRAQLETTQARMVAAARRAAELEDSAKALTALLDELARAARAPRAAKAPALALAKLDLPRHSLPWPAAGRLVSDFGREKDASLGTWTVRQGLLLETKASAPVAAVAPGQVIYVGAFRSYGKVVIVDHGSGFFSVYGSLGDILKSKGDAARSGEPIARAGAAPDGGGRVYLEIRRGTVALDPKAWLQMREGAN
jgi:septal ring factor EnvC (AmiA/AmiB activator)